MAKQATDTFVADMADGTQRRVIRGEVFPDGHAVVRHAPNLFTDFDTREDEKPAARGRKAS
jgi:hypothetical protein